MFLAVFSSDSLGIVAIFENQNPEKIVRKLEKSNPDMQRLKKQFKFPGGSLIAYDVKALKNKWVITQADKSNIDREFDNWPLINGEFEP